jgi:predicted RNase H-like HicB family nuclease
MHAEVQVVVYREDDFWVARALPVEVSSFGRSRPEALAAIREALELYFEDDPEVASPAIASSDRSTSARRGGSRPQNVP